MTSPTNGWFIVSLGTASATRMPSLSNTGRRQARPGVFDDQFTLKLIESGRDSVGIPPSNIVLKSQARIGERKPA
jgi:hypothetical protein